MSASHNRKNKVDIDDEDTENPVEKIPSLGITIHDEHWLDETALILDLDETLIETQFNIKSLIDLKILEDPNHIHIRNRIMILDFYNSKGELTDYQMWSIKRPYVDDLLKYAFKNINYVVVWSAGKKHYVERVSKGLFTDAGHPEPDAILHREDCYDYDGDLIKPLDLLYKKLPWLIGRVKRENMVLLDDKESTFIMNAERGLLINKYEPKISIKGIEAEDRHLLDAINCIHNKLVIKNNARC